MESETRASAETGVSPDLFSWENDLPTSIDAYTLLRNFTDLEKKSHGQHDIALSVHSLACAGWMSVQAVRNALMKNTELFAYEQETDSVRRNTDAKRLWERIVASLALTKSDPNRYIEKILEIERQPRTALRNFQRCTREIAYFNDIPDTEYESPRIRRLHAKLQHLLA